MSGGANFSATWLAMAAKLGASRTLAKPFTIPQLTAAVDAVLAARREPPPSALPQ
jgi:DNA-binding response OmpR family regulator